MEPVTGLPPNLADEINRKTVEALEWLVLAVEQDKITNAQFDAAVNAIWITSSGLVDRDVTELMSEAVSRKIDGFTRKRIFSNTSHLVCLERNYEKATLTIRRKFEQGHWQDVIRKTFEGALVPSLAARDAESRLVDKLRSQGFSEL